MILHGSTCFCQFLSCINNATLRQKLKQPLALKELLLEAFRRDFQTSLSDIDRLKEEWAHLVGLPLADHALPVRIVKNRLYVEVSAGVWNHEMNYKKTELLETFLEKYPAIQEIRIQLRKSIL